MTHNTLQGEYLLLVAVSLAPIADQLLKSVLKAYQPHLRQKPGPWVAKLSGFWRIVSVRDGNVHESYRELHKKYGAIVRTASNVIDISDPRGIASTYGINSKFNKSSFYPLWTLVFDNSLGVLFDHKFAASM
ncbi:hypothetical protein A1F94_008377 [Pyrenophora tritici-repentis]|uniref:Uncharacterized protein n=1 Tax=Pyrenophora tritici-repentis TaxID=45151 RepID=A0A2W1FNP7_9PLEO|nr:hypothetical protein PtrV1_05986 [Pyrenophora tritici-repentis]KAF7573367.1 hypothetical protein PtrM4_082720 [Pyrenophora tritici-repentis]KAG9381057.1 hypothetical protein A1F94_008377 [Pyrenophora tritici-repentis]KAI0568821.1 hypothetical protein Alg215_11978 [Pyrenophora tritici-repentis]KAI0576765.1 hypothetical protein Alg130_08662 [Pyrenophora tritici-repentis]